MKRHVTQTIVRNGRVIEHGAMPVGPRSTEHFPCSVAGCERRGACACLCGWVCIHHGYGEHQKCRLDAADASLVRPLGAA